MPLIEAVSDHIELHIGPIGIVMHEKRSEYVHVDVYRVDPTPKREFYTLITSGLGERPMRVPAEVDAPNRAELMICLPPDWPVQHEDFHDETHYWPIRLLKSVARLPHTDRAWLAPGHTVGSEDPDARLGPSVGFTASIVWIPATTPDGFWRLSMQDGRIVAFYCLVPIYAEELAFKQRCGSDALMDRLLEADVTELVDVVRPSVCT